MANKAIAPSLAQHFVGPNSTLRDLAYGKRRQ